MAAPISSQLLLREFVNKGTSFGFRIPEPLGVEKDEGAIAVPAALEVLGVSAEENLSGSKGDMPLGRKKKGNLGLEIFTYVILRAGQLELVMTSVLIRVSLRKTIIKTPVVERRGTVKELFGTDDYQIKISGNLSYPVGTAKSKQYPTDLVNKLRRICEFAGPIQISCPQLNEIYNIKSLVIEGAEFPEPIVMNQQGFSLACISDEPVALYLK